MLPCARFWGLSWVCRIGRRGWRCLGFVAVICGTWVSSLARTALGWLGSLDPTRRTSVVCLFIHWSECRGQRQLAERSSSACRLWSGCLRVFCWFQSIGRFFRGLGCFAVTLVGARATTLTMCNVFRMLVRSARGQDCCCCYSMIAVASSLPFFEQQHRFCPLSTGFWI